MSLLNCSQKIFQGISNTISFHPQKNLIFGDKCYTIGVLFAVGAGLYICKKVATIFYNKVLKKDPVLVPVQDPFPLQKLGSQGNKDIFLCVADRLPLKDVLSLRRTFQSASQILDQPYLEQRVYKEIVNEVVAGLKNDISHKNFTRVIDSLVKIDKDIALVFSPKLGSLKFQNLAGFGFLAQSIAQFQIAMACESKNESKKIYEQLIKDLEKRINQQGSKLHFINQLLMCYSVLSKIDPKKSAQMKTNAENILKQHSHAIADHIIAKFLSRNIIDIDLQSFEQMIKHEFSDDSLRYILSALLRTGKFRGDEEIFKLENNWRGEVYRCVKDAQKDLDKELLNMNSKFGNHGKIAPFLRIKCLMKIHKELREQKDIKNAKKVLKVAKGIALKSKDGISIAEVAAQNPLSNPNGKLQADKLFRLSEKLIREEENSNGRIMHLVILAKKMRKCFPEKTNMILTEVLQALIEKNICQWSRNDDIIYDSIIDFAPQPFWTPKLNQLVKKLDPKYKLLYQLKILENYKNLAIKNEFLKILKTL